MAELKNASFKTKAKFTLPKGASIIKKDVSLRVEEIENGYIIEKSYDIKYQSKDGGSEYEYFTKRWFSETNPLEIEVESEEISLADLLD